jgi:hypothetical protein
MMAGFIPENSTRLQATAFVKDAELNAIGRGEIIRTAAKQMAENALRKILNDCIRTESYMGYPGQTLYLDVYVISPDELNRIIQEARLQGERDALRWTNDPFKESL